MTFCKFCYHNDNILNPWRVYTYVRIYVCIYTCISVYVCMHVLCMHARVHVYVRMYECLYVNVRMSVFMYVCVVLCMYVLFFFFFWTQEPRQSWQFCLSSDMNSNLETLQDYRQYPISHNSLCSVSIESDPMFLHRGRLLGHKTKTGKAALWNKVTTSYYLQTDPSLCTYNSSQRLIQVYPHSDMFRWWSPLPSSRKAIPQTKKKSLLEGVCLVMHT